MLESISSSIRATTNHTITIFGNASDTIQNINIQAVAASVFGTIANALSYVVSSVAEIAASTPTPVAIVIALVIIGVGVYIYVNRGAASPSQPPADQQLKSQKPETLTIEVVEVGNA